MTKNLDELCIFSDFEKEWIRDQMESKKIEE